jgi:hypothetical protein
MTQSFTEVIPKILAQGLLALRQNCVMPRLVNSDYSKEAAMKGSAVTIPIPSAVPVQQVTPGAYSNVTNDSAPTSATLTLDKWYEAPFYLSDKDVMEVMRGVIPMQASEAIKSLANQVNGDIMALYKDIPYVAGTPNVTPFASTTQAATDVRKVLNINLAPLSDRRMVIGPDAEANALGLRQFTDFSFTGEVDGIRNARLNEKLGFMWAMDQAIPTHTPGTVGGDGTTATKVKTETAVGSTSLVVTVGASNALDLNKGDVINIAGDTNPYVVTADAAGNATTDVTLSIYPGLKAIAAADAEVTCIGTSGTAYTVNLGFHRDAFAFATRPLVDSVDGLGNYIKSAVDPVSGMALRLEVTREHKRTRYSFDVLYGVTTVRRELACRLLG